MKWRGRKVDPRLLTRLRRHQVRQMKVSRPTFLAHSDGRHQVQTQERQVDQVVAREDLVAQVGVHQTQATEAAIPGPQPANLWQHDARGVAHEDLLDLALA